MNTDVLCIQEHCLFNYEENKLGRILPQWYSHIQSVDEGTEQDNVKCTAGCGGVAMLCNPHLNPYVTHIETETQKQLLTHIILLQITSPEL